MPLPSLNPTADKGSFSQRFLEKASKVKDTSEKWLNTIFGDASQTDTGGGKSKLGKDNKKNPQRTSIGSGSSTRLKMGDSIADIMAKQYIFMQRAYEAQKQEDELNVALRKEQMDEDERRHKKLIEELVKAKQPTAIPEKEEEKKQDDSWIKKMLGGIKDSLFTVLKGLLNAIMSPLKLLTSLVSSIMGIVTSIATSLAKTVFKVIAEGASGIVKLLLLPLTSLISGIVANAFKALAGGISGLAGAFGQLLGPIGKVIATMVGVAYADSEYRQQYEKEAYGPETNALMEQNRKLTESEDPGQRVLKPNEREDMNYLARARALEEAKARAKFEKEVLIPAMARDGFKPDREPSEKPGIAAMTFRHEKTNEVADIFDIKKALHGADWMQKEMMSMVFNEKKTFKEMASGEIEKINAKLESEMAKTKKDYIDPLITPITDKLKEIEERMEGLQNNFGAKLESLKQMNDDFTKGLNTEPNPPPATNSSVTILGSSNNNIGGGNEMQNGDYMESRHGYLRKNTQINSQPTATV
jgi:hypothetical protein